MFLEKRGVRARELMKSIEVRFIQMTDESKSQRLSLQQKIQGFFQTHVSELPTLKSVNISVGFIGGEANDTVKEELINAIVGFAGIFRAAEKLEICYTSTIRRKQRDEIVQEAKERIRKRDWAQLTELGPDFVYCSEEQKAVMKGRII
jgi:hypothetical protein